MSSGLSVVTFGAAHLGEALEQDLLARAVGAQRLAGLGAVAGQRQEQVLDGDVVVLEVAPLAVGGAQDLAQRVGRAGRLRAVAERGKRVERGVGLAADAGGIGADLLEQRRDDRLLLLEQRDEHVLGRHLGVAALLGEGLRRGDDLAGLEGEAIRVHMASQI